MTARQLHVHFLPTLFQPSSLTGGIAVVIDILRASSTMITAFHNGAASVVPCATPEEAMAVRSARPAEPVLLGGERGGVRIEGFDLGNSPAEYTRSVVAGRTVAFTTTNGTKALLAASHAEAIVVGGFLNLSSLIRRLSTSNLPIHLLCAGTDGDITGEDVLFAGCVTEKLLAESSDATWMLNDSAGLSRHFWRSTVLPIRATDQDQSEQVAAAFRETRGGRNLLELGYDRDLDLCSRIDSAESVPQFDRPSGCLCG